MRTVLIMRHGKSKWSEEGVGDHDRSLAKRGKRDARRMGAEMRSRGLVPDVILSSTAKRARSTARRVAKAVGCDRDVLYEQGLYFDGLEPYLGALSNLPEDVCVAMIIGHNPLLEELIVSLTHEDTGTDVILIDRPGVPGSTLGCPGDNIDVLLDEAALNSVETACRGTPPAISGRLRPNQSLDGYVGEGLAGDWVLQVSDNTAGDNGALNGWCMLVFKSE